jgi:hypothetical protein
LAYPVCQILPQMIEPVPSPDIAGFFLEAQVTAERCPPVVDQHLAVAAHFELQIGLQLASIQEIAEATKELFHGL